MKKVNILEELKALQESAPVESMEALRDKLREALNLAKLFGSDSYPYIRYTFLNKVIVEASSKIYQVSYMFDANGVTFETPEEVEETFAVKESAAFTIVKEAQDMDLEVSDFLDLSDAKYNAKTSEFENVILIEAGTNMAKRRHYPESTIREAAAAFAGLKMYINHPTKQEEKDRPERDVRDWVSTVTESVYDSGKARAKVAIHDPWLKERLADPVFKKNIGLSINAGGKISIGLVEGQEMQIVEQIIPKRQNGPASVDWVTEAGARGRVENDLLESRREDMDMDFKTLTLEILKAARPDLVTAIAEGATAEFKTKEKELQESAATLKRDNMLMTQKDSIMALLKESKLPQAAQDRIFDSIKETLFDDDAKLKEAVSGSVTSERAYISQFSKKGAINLGAGKEVNLVESTQGTLEAQMGIEKKAE